MKKVHFNAFRLITLIGIMVIGAACAPPETVSIPTLVELPTLTDTPPPSETPAVTDTVIPSDTPSLTPTETATPTATPTAAPSDTPSPAVPTPSATQTASETPARTAPPTITLTPSETITETITPSLTPSLTASPDIGAFGALVDLASRVTVLPVETRYSAPTLTALAAARAQIASQTPPGAVVIVAAGPGLQLATLPPGVAMPTIAGAVSTPGQIVGPLPDAQATPLLPPLICQYPAPGSLPLLLATDAALANSLGCAVGAPPVISQLPAASQVFERGTMVYIASPTGGVGSIYALTQDNRFRRFDDPFVPGVDPESMGESVPPGLLEPVRGFGEVWRVNLDVRGSLGYALAPEQGDTASAADFNRGRVIYVPARGVTYVLIDDLPGAGVGTWRALMGGF